MAQYMKSKANWVVFPYDADLVRQGLADECDAKGNLPQVARDVPPPVNPLAGAEVPPANEPPMGEGQPEPAADLGNDLEATKARILAMDREGLIAEARAMGLSFQPNTGKEKLQKLILEAITGG